MDCNRPQKILNQAASQANRWKDAPHPAGVEVDGRSLAQLLTFAGEYGALINFFDLADSPDGDWTIFFTSDSSIALAMLASLDLASIGAELGRALARLRTIKNTKKRLRELIRVITAILRLVRIVDNGHRSPGPAGASLARAVRREIKTGLATPMQRFGSHAAVAVLDQKLRLDLSGLSPLWGLNVTGGASEPLPRDSGWIDEIIAALQELVDALLGALQRLSASATALLQASLRAEGHAPQAALYNAFATVFGHAQATVNRFPGRLVDFYYGTILQQESCAALPDQLYLTFMPAKDITVASVPKGTLFPAGTDTDGAVIAYAAERSLTVYPSAIAALRTLRVTQAPLTLGDDEIVQPPAPALVLSGIVSLADKPPVIAKPFAPFGDSVPGSNGVLTTSPASLGFALASPTLLLASGQRTIHLKLTIGPKSLAALKPALDAIAQQAGGLSVMEVLAQILQAGFRLQYSAAGGWVAVEGYTATILPAAAQDAAFDLSFTLKTGAEPFVAMATIPPSASATPPAPGSAVPDANRPVLLASLRQERIAVGKGGIEARVYPYAILSGLALSGLTVSVNVSGFGAFAVSTPDGPADTTKPFALFGSPPAQNGALTITAPELFAKRLDSLSLTLTWYALPQTATGFKGYYQGYRVDLDGNTVPPGTPPLFDNTSFQVAMAVVNPGSWTIPATPLTSQIATKPTYLFRTADKAPLPQPDKPVLTATVFDAINVVRNTPPAYYNAANSAVRFTLTAPPYAFGDTLYARNVMAAALQEAPLAASCSELCAKRCAPPPEIAQIATALDGVAAVNARASDKRYREALAKAIANALAQMTGVALRAIQDGLAKLSTTVSADTIAKLRASLTDAMAAAPQGEEGLLGRLSDLFSRHLPNTVDVAHHLSQWLASAGVVLGGAAAADRDQARALLGAAQQMIDAALASKLVPPAVARPQMGAALIAAKASLVVPQTDCLQKCLAECMGRDPAKSYPNAPWLPTALLSLDYSAISTVLPQNGDSYYYLEPFDAVTPVSWPDTGEVPLLTPQMQEGALFIALSGTPANPTLLFEMTAGPAGWSDNPPPLAWAQLCGTTWSPLTPPDTLQGDGTNSLQNSGIVTLQLQPPQDDSLLWLRLSVSKDPESFPHVAGITANAMVAGWVGPGGAHGLGVPLPAGTITASDPALADIATIAQPLPSFGGRPLAVGKSFQMAMAERLRHKNRAIQAWDYARLALGEFPALWQVAVLPAVDGNDQPAPGHLRLIVVPGPATPNITDTMQPLADPTQLAEIGEMLATRISAFVKPTVANPAYVRIKVKAKLVFSDANTVAAWTVKLNSDLQAWLSPWPPQNLGKRPADYTSTFAIGDFIRSRPYVLAILELGLTYDPPAADWCYLTSALQHDLSGTLEAAP